MDEENPYASPVEDKAYVPKDTPHISKQYGGIRRLAYFGLSFLLGLVLGVAGALIGVTEGFLIIGLQYIILIGLASARLKNVGYSPWLSILIVIPIANIFIGIICLAYQEGYIETKKLDTAGRIIVGLFLGFIALIILLAVIGALA